MAVLIKPSDFVPWALVDGQQGHLCLYTDYVGLLSITTRLVKVFG